MGSEVSVQPDPVRIKLPEPVAAIYRAVAELNKTYERSGRTFSSNGHLGGSIGAAVAAEALGLKIHSNSHPGRLLGRAGGGKFRRIALPPIGRRKCPLTGWTS
jgi:hypothetical protein